jgi:hypothetical protein
MADEPLVNSRETRDWAREVKFLVDAKLRDEIVAWSRENLGPDGNGSGDHKDEYSTTSLYFETPEFDVYRRKKSYGRAKFRARRYGMMDIVFLERKFRTERLLSKRRTTVPVAEVQKLADPVPDKTWPAYWFHRRILLRRLQPLTQMSYDRVARIGQAQYGPVRMTIDQNLRVLPMPDRAFIPGVGLPLIEDKCIVEVKFRVELPAMFRQLTERFQLAPMSVSKYRIGLKVLDYAPQTKTDAKVPSSTPGGATGPAS